MRTNQMFPRRITDNTQRPLNMVHQMFSVREDCDTAKFIVCPSVYYFYLLYKSLAYDSIIVQYPVYANGYTRRWRRRYVIECFLGDSVPAPYAWQQEEERENLAHIQRTRYKFAADLSPCSTFGHLYQFPHFKGVYKFSWPKS